MSNKNTHTVENIFEAIKNHFGYRKDVELANWIGVSNKLLWNWKNKNAIADLNAFIRKGISEQWLRTGKGEMFISPSEATPEQWKEIAETNKMKAEAGQSFEIEMVNYAKQLEDILKPIGNKFERGILVMEAFKAMDEKVRHKQEEDK